MPAIARSRKPVRRRSSDDRRLPGGTASSAALSSLSEKALDAARMCIWTASGDSLVVKALFPENPAFLRVVTEGNAGKAWLDRIHPLDRGSVSLFLNKLSSAEPEPFIEYRLLTADLDSLWVRHWITGVDSSKGIFSGAIAEIEEIHWLRRESIHISEREQNRIGQELHDDLCQVLAGLGCLLKVLENRVASRIPEEVENLREINTQMVEAMERTRALTHGLFPARLKTATVREALAELVSQLKTRFPVEIEIRFHGVIPTHSSDSILNVYRIAQEAASNAIKHGRATRIEIALRRKGSLMELTLKDNGCGYNKPGDGAGIGIEIMRNRARILGGEMILASIPGKGVTVTITYQAKPR